MKLLVQWATKHPHGWVELDSTEWNALPKKPVPLGNEKIDDEPGWLANVCVQGMCTGTVDHVAVEHLGDSVRVTTWCDDPEDYKPGKFRARVLTFHPLRPDPALGGALNTHIESVIYAGPDDYAELKAQNFVDSELRHWREFVPPPEEVTRHGIWLTDRLAARHRKLARPVSWREWGEDGTVPCQRDLGLWARAKGTVTYYWRGGGTGDDGGSDVMPASINYKLTLTSTTVYDVTRDIPLATTDEISYAFSTEPGVPNNADWPTGDYRAQIDINALEDSNVSCKVVILRVNSLGVIRETIGTSGSYTTVATHLFTVSSYNPSAGASSDRYQVRVLGTNAYAHQARLLTLGVRSTDSYADGPWTAPVQDSSTRAARTAGKVADVASDRDARTEGQVTTTGDRDARTLGGLTTVSDRDARTEGRAGPPQYIDHTVYKASVLDEDPSFEHIVPAGDNRLLLVFQGMTDGELNLNSITYDGNTLTFLSRSPDMISSLAPMTAIYYRLLGSSASPTTADIVLDSNGAMDDWNYVVAVNLTGVDQFNPLGTNENAKEESSTSVSVDITTDTADSLLFGGGGVWLYEETAPVTQDDGQTERWDEYTADDGIDAQLWGSQLDVPTVQQYSFGVTKSASLANNQSINVVEVHAVSTEASSARAARTAGKVTDASSTRDARTHGGLTTTSDRDARTAGKESDIGSTRDARTRGKVTDAGSARGAATIGMADRDDNAGTVTYYMRGTWGGGGTGDDADHACVPGAYGFKLSKDDAAQARVGDTVPGTTSDRISFSWTTESPEPPMPWPSGNYRAQVHVVAIGPDIVFRIQLLRIKVSDCTVLETLGTSGNLSGTGLHEFSVSGYDPGDTGKFQIRVICDNSHGSPENIKLNVRGTLSFVDGPWRYSADDTRDARTAGKVTDASDTRAARTEGAVAGTQTDTTRDARTEGKITGTQTADTRDARTAGMVTDAADTRDARTEGQVTTATTRDARTEGQVTTAGTRSARTEGVTPGGTQAASNRDARTAGRATTVSDRDARTAGQAGTSDTRDARTAGAVTTDSNRGARTAGQVSSASSNRDARTYGGIASSSARSARTEGVGTVVPHPPGMAHENHPDPSEAGGRTPQAKFYVLHSESMEERVKAMFPKGKRKQRK